MFQFLSEERSVKEMRLKLAVLLSCVIGTVFLYGCGAPAAPKEPEASTVATAEEPAGNSTMSLLEEAAAAYEEEPVMSQEELENIDWDEEILPYMEYDWLGDRNIDRYLDTGWIMSLADLNLDGQPEMLVTLPIYNSVDMTFVYTVKAGVVIYCGEIIAGPAYIDNDIFMAGDSYLPSSYLDVYKNDSGEFRYLSSDDYTRYDSGYYQIYESSFDGTGISCEPVFAINFAKGSDGTMHYAYASGDWLSQENVIADDEDYTGFTKVMEAYMEGYEKIDISFTVSEYRVPGIVDELPEEVKEIVRNNIKAGFAKVL